MSKPFSYWVMSTVSTTLAGCLSVLALFWAGFCFFFGGPEGRVGSDAMLWGGISIGFSVVLAGAGFLFYISPIRVASGSGQFIHHLANRAGPFLSALLLALLIVFGGVSLLVFAGITIGIALSVRWIAYSRNA